MVLRAAWAIALCLAALPALPAEVQVGRSAAVAGVTPLEKVVQMLDDLLAKGKEEKHTEEVEFASFQQWCGGIQSETTKSIAEATSQIQQLEATIAKSQADAEVLSSEIADLEAETAQANAEAKNATEVRRKEKADYDAQHQDLSESIDACKRAIQELKARSAAVPQALLQVRGLLRAAPAAAALDSLLALGASQAPEASAYESQSGGVVAVLANLASEFQAELLAAEKAEVNVKSSFELLAQQLADDVGSYGDDVAQKTAERAARLELAGVSTGELHATEASKAEDEKTLSDTQAECQVRAEEFEKNQVTRADEIKAIEQALEILSSSDVAGNAKTYLPTLVQVRPAGATALAQLRSRARAQPEARQRAVELLQARAASLGSRYLALAAARAAADPFAKVTQLIKGLIAKLTEQANGEADHHAYCQTELATNKQTRDDAAAQAERLAAEAEQLEARAAELASELQDLSTQLAELRSHQEQATKLRGEEKATNSQTVVDAKAAQGAVEAATKVLRDYYSKAAEASLLQAGARPYTGMQAASTGVLGLLEVVLSDFARLEAETSSAEDEAAASFERFMAESDEAVAVKQTTASHHEQSRLQAEERARDLQRELELTQEGLDKALEYYEKLKADCVETGLSYEERVRAREAEVQSLREALSILDQQDLA